MSMRNCMLVHQRLRGWLAVAGGFLVHLTLGTLYTSGNMAPYIASYIRAYSHPSDINYVDTTWIFALALGGQGMIMFLGGIIHNKIGPRWTTLLGGWLMSSGVLLTSWTINVSFYLTVATSGLLFGVGIGFAYAPPLACAMKWFPHHKGLVNGIVVAGFGGGAFIFNQVQTAFINPNNEVPDQPVSPGSSERYFSKENQASVLANVPHCYLLMGSCYAVMQFIGAMLLVDPAKKTDYELQEENSLVNESEYESFSEEEKITVENELNIPDVHPIQMLRSKEFYILWFLFLVNGQAVVFISSLYKAYGQVFITGDYFLALVGSFASICNCGGRVIWGRLCDRLSFGTTMLILCSVMIACLSTLKLTEYGGKPMFFIWICLIFFTFSGNFVLFPTGIAQIFGGKYVAINYGLLFSSQVVSSLIGATLAVTLKSIIGWLGMFSLLTTFSLTGWILTVVFRRVQNGKSK